VAEKQEHKFPSEIIDLPSEGKLYPKDSPLSSGKLEIKYMTAREEDILTSQNLIKKGVVIDHLLNSLILTKGVSVDDLVLGDKNAIMVAARILAYGPEYVVEITNPITDTKFEQSFNLADCPFKKISDDIKGNEFEVILPVSKVKITFRLLTGKNEREIDTELKQLKKLGGQISPELTTRLKYTITSIDGDSASNVIRNFVDTMLSRDSLFLRGEITKVSPDIELQQEVEIGGELVKVDIPMTTNFFWPDA
jgi:hypothetical protein